MRTTLLPIALSLVCLACSEAAPAPAGGDADGASSPSKPTEPAGTPTSPSAPAGAAPEAAVHGGVILPQGEAPSSAEALLVANLAALKARGEHKVPQIEVQHLLVGVTNARMPDVKRTPDAARLLAADYLQRLAAGADLGALILEHSDDPPRDKSRPGIYGMVLSGGGNPMKNVFPRSGMVDAFGDVVWRLEVGEIGVAAHDPNKSPFGYHIIKCVR